MTDAWGANTFPVRKKQLSNLSHLKFVDHTFFWFFRRFPQINVGGNPKIRIQRIKCLPLRTISRMSYQSINFSAFNMPHQLFCIMSISKQSPKPWYYWKIPTNLCWSTVLCGCNITVFMLVDLVAGYTTCWACAHFCILISIQYAIIWTCMDFLVLHSHWT